MKTLLSTAYEKLMVFHPANVTGVERLGEAFYLVSLQSEVLQGVTWVPGQKTQFLVDSLTKRAYTPMDVDPTAGTAKFLFYRHGQGPASAWAAALRDKDICKIMRPKNSIDFTEGEGPALFFGDETSFAAARTLRQSGRKAPCYFIFEVDSPKNAQAVVSRLELEKVRLVPRLAKDFHFEQVAEHFLSCSSRLPSPSWFFTGRGPAIQALRKRLNRAGVSLSKGATKAYWSAGRKGLD